MDANGIDSSEPPSELASEDIHGVLSNKRRRYVIELLQENGGEMTARELSERIATAETGEDPPPRNKRQSAYVSLLQTHLPKLDDLDIVTYDSDSKQVTLEDSVDQVSIYLETVPKYGISWSELYMGLAILGFLTTVGADFGVPVLSVAPSLLWSTLFLGGIGVAALYQIYQQESSIIHRLRY